MQPAESGAPDYSKSTPVRDVLAALGMPPRDLFERTRLFALAVLTFCRRLPRTDEAQETARQLRRAANSVRSNYRAARRGRSRAEFQAKIGTVFEEADECVDCLQYLQDAGIARDAVLLQEAKELASIFAKSVQTARNNTQKLKNSPKRLAPPRADEQHRA